MLKHYAEVRRAAAVIANAAETAVRGLNEGRIQGEEAFTDRMIGAIEDRLQGGVSMDRLEDDSVLPSKGMVAHAYIENHRSSIKWSAMTLTAHQRSAQETEFGADFLGALEVDLPDYKIKKGFLSQAKLVEPEDGMSNKEFKRLQEQCEKMLKHTPDSFVFLYSRNGVRVTSALGVVGMSGSNNPYDTYTRSLARFFEEHFQSFVGDRRIQAANSKALAALRADLGARTGFLLTAEEQ